MGGDLLRPGWPWFRFQKIWTDRINPWCGLDSPRTVCVICVMCVVAMGE